MSDAEKVVKVLRDGANGTLELAGADLDALADFVAAAQRVREFGTLSAAMTYDAALARLAEVLDA